MIIRLTLLFAIFLSPLALADVEPNLEPGLWEYQTEMTYEGDIPIPDSSETNQDCITAEDLADADFLQPEDGCELVEKDLRTDGMTYAMECREADGTGVTLRGDMQFMGNTSEGLITGEAETPMGPVTMRIETRGERISDC